LDVYVDWEPYSDERFLNDKDFPYSVDIGAGRGITIRGPYSEDFVSDQASRFTAQARSQSLRTITALCESRAALIKEGLDLEKLRRELVLDIQRARQERAKQQRRKELEIEVEKPQTPEE
jgi:hypothetical protein